MKQTLQHYDESDNTWKDYDDDQVKPTSTHAPTCDYGDATNCVYKYDFTNAAGT